MSKPFGSKVYKDNLFLRASYHCQLSYLRAEENPVKEHDEAFGPHLWNSVPGACYHTQ